MANTNIWSDKAPDARGDLHNQDTPPRPELDPILAALPLEQLMISSAQSTEQQADTGASDRARGDACPPPPSGESAELRHSELTSR
jgi:hypothetical protein